MLFEYCLDLFPRAGELGLYTYSVSNSYMTREALQMLADAGMDAINIDMKGSAAAYQRYCAADSEVVWRNNIGEAKRLGLHVEVVNFIIPGVNDDGDSLPEIIGSAERSILPCRSTSPGTALRIDFQRPQQISGRWRGRTTSRSAKGFCSPTSETCRATRTKTRTAHPAERSSSSGSDMRSPRSASPTRRARRAGSAYPSSGAYLRATQCGYGPMWPNSVWQTTVFSPVPPQ